MKETQTLSAHQNPKPGPAGSLPQPSPWGTAAQHPNPWPKHPARPSPFSLLAARANSRSPDPALGPAPAASSTRPTPAPRDAPLSPSSRARSLPPGPRRQRPHELSPRLTPPASTRTPASARAASSLPLSLRPGPARQLLRLPRATARPRSPAKSTPAFQTRARTPRLAAAL